MKPEQCPTCSKGFLRSGPGGAAAWADHPAGYGCPDPWHEPKLLINGVACKDHGDCAFETREPSPMITVPLVLDSEADKSLQIRMAAGPLNGEEFVVGELRFKVSRVVRTVDSLTPGEARYSFWAV